MITSIAVASSSSSDMSWQDVIITLASFVLLGFIVWLCLRD
jgi:hypothetical protein